MKHDDFWKQLNAELDSVGLPMSDRVKNEPIQTANGQTKNANKTGAGTRLRRIPRKAATAAIACAAAVAITAVGVLGALLPHNDDSTGGLPNTATFAAEPTCMYLSINPSVVTLLNTEGVVEKTVALNRDGDALLLGDGFGESLKGLSAVEAAKRLAERAAAMGYMDLTANGDGGYNGVSIRFEGENAADGDLLSSVRTGVTEWFKQKGVLVYVEAESVIREGFDEMYGELLNAPTSHLRGEASEDAQVALQSFLGEMIAEVADGALRQYDLYQEIFQTNAAIEKSTGITVGGLTVSAGNSFWALDDEDRKKEGVSALEADMVCLLDEMYYGFGMDFRRATTVMHDYGNELAFETAYAFSSQQADNAEYFRAYREDGLQGEEVSAELVLKLTEFGSVHGYSDRLLEGAATLVGAILEWTQEGVASYLESAEALLVSHAEGLYQRYSAVLEEKRPPITDGEYEAFLQKISAKNERLHQ